jgi:DNA modification methylase
VYKTRLGKAYLGDSLEVMKGIPDESVNLIITSPPFALQRKKDYGNEEADRYVNWFLQFAPDFRRVLKQDGSLVIDIGGSWNKGSPTRSLYHFELLVALHRKARFHLAQEFFWWNRAKLPSPAEWVTVRRIRVKDAVNCVWWLSKTEKPKADNRRVLQPYSESMKLLLKNGYKAKMRPSGWDISTKFSKNNNGSIPPNIIEISNTDSNSHYLRRCREKGIKPHPARFPQQLPEFFIKFLTDENDVVLDPFAGSNVTGALAEKLGRRWIAIELDRSYLAGSQFRFEEAAQRTRPRSRPKPPVVAKAAALSLF